MALRSQLLATAIEAAEQHLAAAGVWAPREDAEALAAHVLGVEPDELVPETAVDARACVALHEAVARRASRVPLAHITGRSRLGGIDVAVGPNVFVPRIHTEPMLAWGLEVLQARRSPIVVDLCTGSGAIALAIAHACPQASVHAVDCDEAALAYAYRNAARRATAGDTPIALRKGDITDPQLLTELDGTVDLVVANPPNVADGTPLLPEWGEHHPPHAIYAGDDGLALIRAVVGLAARLLRSGGGVAVEHADPPAAPALPVVSAHGAFTAVSEGIDHAGRPRYTTGLRAKETRCTQ
jgi:release factor glutamine methyltransferase